jgi:hypothetical protein
VAHFVEHEEPRSQLEALLHIVRDHEDGHLVRRPQLDDQAMHVRRDAWIQRAERLIQ